MIYADKAYDTKANQAWLRARGIQNGILKKEAHHIQLTAEDRENNHQKSLVRRQIERIFAHLKKWQHYRRVRYLGLARNQLELTLKAMLTTSNGWQASWNGNGHRKTAAESGEGANEK